MRAWVVRGGLHGEYEEKALAEGLVILGWDEVADIGPVASRDELRRMLEEIYPGRSSYVIGNWTGQLWRFRAEISVGDLVVLPRKSKLLAIGRVTGPYACRGTAESGFEHVRAAEWLRTDIRRTAVKQDLLGSMGSLLTVFELRRNDAAARIAALASGEQDPGSSDSEPATPEYASTAELLEAAAARETSDPVILPIRALLGLWGHTRRGSAVVDQIQTELAALGLTTQPPFTDGSINSVVAIVPRDVDPDRIDEPILLEEADLPPVSYLISNLESADIELEWVSAHDPLTTATTKMLLGNYSQLPVLDDERRLRGVISWESIGKANISGTPVTVEDAKAGAKAVGGTEILFDAVREIYERGFVFVSDHEQRITGIITTADLTDQFAGRVKPFVLVEEVEQRLRRALDRALATKRLCLDDVRACVNSKPENIQSAKDLTLGQYWHVLKPQDNWERLTWPVDHTLFLSGLKAVTKFRNDLMHFSPDPLPDSGLNSIHGMLTILKVIDPVM